MTLKEIFKDREYMDIVKPYLAEEKIQSLKNIPHHNSNRLEHCIKVSYSSYKWCKKMNLNYESAAKAGLLHDLYFNRIEECSTVKDKLFLFTNEHPEDAVKNAEEIFYLSNLEKDIIVSHMWPASKHMPKRKESFMVSLADKYYSFFEVGMKWNYNLTFTTGVFFLFVMYSIFN